MNQVGSFGMGGGLFRYYVCTRSSALGVYVH